MTAFPDENIAQWAFTHFDIPDVKHVRLLRAYTNDVYLVETRQQRYVLKVYGTGWRRDSEIRFEIALLDHLASKGVLVARPIVGVNGDALQFAEADGLERQVVLFEYAAGEKPVPPFAPEMYHCEGKAVGLLHLAADDFTTHHERRSLDLATLIDEPLALIRSQDIDDSTRSSILDTGEWLRSEIMTRAQGGLNWGVCHGDLTFDNLHITTRDEFVWYDFDSGGLGWRAIDLQGWAFGRPEWTDHWQAFLDGYRESRSISENDIAAAPYLNAAQEIWSIQVDLERRVIARGNVAVRAHITKRAKQLAQRRDQLMLSESSPRR